MGMVKRSLLLASCLRRSRCMGYISINLLQRYFLGGTSSVIHANLSFVVCCKCMCSLIYQAMLLVLQKSLLKADASHITSSYFLALPPSLPPFPHLSLYLLTLGAVVVVRQDISGDGISFTWVIHIKATPCQKNEIKIKIKQ